MDIVFLRYNKVAENDEEYYLERDLFDSDDLENQKETRQIYEMGLILDKYDDIAIWTGGSEDALKYVRTLSKLMEVDEVKNYNFLNEGNYDKFLKTVNDSKHQLVLIIDQEPTLGMFIEKLTGVETRLQSNASAFVSVDRKRAKSYLLASWQEGHRIDLEKNDDLPDFQFKKWLKLYTIRNYQRIIFRRYQIIEDVKETKNIYKLRKANRRYLNLQNILQPYLEEKYYIKITERMSIINERLTLLRVLDLLIQSVEDKGMEDSQLYGEIKRHKSREEHVLRKYFMSYDGRKNFNSILKNSIKAFDKTDVLPDQDSIHRAIEAKMIATKEYVENNIDRIEDMSLDEIWELKSQNENFIFTYEVKRIIDKEVCKSFKETYNDFYVEAILRDDLIRDIFNKNNYIYYLDNILGDIDHIDELEDFKERERAALKDSIKKLRE